jgi:hypothetical protein
MAWTTPLSVCVISPKSSRAAYAAQTVGVGIVVAGFLVRVSLLAGKDLVSKLLNVLPRVRVGISSAPRYASKR